MTSCSTRSPKGFVGTHCTSTGPPAVYWGWTSTWVGGAGEGMDVNMGGRECTSTWVGWGWGRDGCQHGWGGGGGGLNVNMGGWGGVGLDWVGEVGVEINMGGWVWASTWMGGVGWMSGSEGGWYAYGPRSRGAV